MNGNTFIIRLLLLSKYLLWRQLTDGEGKDDTHVLFNGGAGEDAFKDESMMTDFTSVNEIINRWIIRNKEEKVSERILDVPGVYADLYPSKYNKTQIELVVTKTGGHSWPEGKPVRGKIPSRAIIVNDLIWVFMRQAP